MCPKDLKKTLDAMAPADKAQVQEALKNMSPEDKGAALTAMSPECKKEHLAALSSEESKLEAEKEAEFLAMAPEQQLAIATEKAALAGAIPHGPSR